MRLQGRPHHSLRFCTPASSSPRLTILTLLRGPQFAPPTSPSPPLTPPCTHLILSATYHPYACLHSTCPTCLQHCLASLRLQFPPDIPPTPPLTLAQSSRPLIILTLLQPPKGETKMPPPISALTTTLPYAPLIILTLPPRPQDMPLMPPSTPLMPNLLSAAYHLYAQVLDT
ncbi:hypothetical protein O181_060719 [Austropuccinia psidii MF-1]|uniref:Uncharacterized protein n=1 Tax=Austropuccinia psidii MF-1 TaxID=1389203 RepID=A0A9Q3HZW5_9BASI|nr:hypothetical protein [Austropuccinia psidii MF-1]